MATETNKGAKGAVCVTGGSGFLGGWCVAQLLEKGYVSSCARRLCVRSSSILRPLCVDLEHIASSVGASTRTFARRVDV